MGIVNYDTFSFLKISVNSHHILNIAQVRKYDIVW
jgi:hypothetical protein